MAEAGREDTTREAPPVDQPTEDSPAVQPEEPQVIDSTAVEEPPVRAAEEEVAPTGGPEPPPGPEYESDGGTSPREAHRRGAEEHGGGGRPELIALGAFAGAFLVAQILKRLGGGDE